ncbi:MAG: hypothetical protein AAFY99_11410 [Pseudomonadota bacterium]
MTNNPSVIFRVLPDGETRTIRGRLAWALLALINNPTGVTQYSHPAPSWSSYISSLRSSDVVIKTARERHGGEFPGFHARYALQSKIEIIEVSNASS